MTAVCTALSGSKIMKLLLYSLLLRNKTIKHLVILFPGQNLQVAVFFRETVYNLLTFTFSHMEKSNRFLWSIFVFIFSWWCGVSSFMEWHTLLILQSFSAQNTYFVYFDGFTLNHKSTFKKIHMYKKKIKKISVHFRDI